MRVFSIGLNKVANPSYLQAELRGGIVISLPAGHLSMHVDHQIKEADPKLHENCYQALCEWYDAPWLVYGMELEAKYWRLFRRGDKYSTEVRKNLGEVLFWIQARKS